MALWIKQNDYNYAILSHEAGVTEYFKKKKVPVRKLYVNSNLEKMFEDKQAVLFFPTAIWHYDTDLVKQCNLRSIPVIGVDADLPEDIDCYFCNISSPRYRSLSVLATYLMQHKRGRIAFFGAKPIEVDLSKAEILYKLYEKFDENDIFYAVDHMDESFDAFLPHYRDYDTVICTNDIVAVYFLEKMSAVDPEYAQNVFLVSFMNSVLSQVYKRSITSLSYDVRNIPPTVLNLYRSMLKNKSRYLLLEAKLECNIFIRESTFHLPFLPPDNFFTTEKLHSKPILKLPKIIPDIKTDDGPLINTLLKLEAITRDGDNTLMKILLLFLQGASNENICKELYLSLSTVKYHSGRLCKLLGVKSKSEFVDIASRYIDPKKLKKYLRRSEDL